MTPPGEADTTDIWAQVPDSLEVRIRQPRKLPDADDSLAYHAARLIILLNFAGDPRTKSIEGRTKLAKMDFLIRYPTYLAEAARLKNVKTTITPSIKPESRMIRYKYGPWDQRYYHSGSILHSRLRLESFTWDRGSAIDRIYFAPGMNIIGERSQTERTILLRMIRYAMGGSHSRIDNDIMAATKQVQLELVANEQRVLITRGFEHPNGNFPVRVDDHPERLINPREMGEFFLDLLDLPKVYYQRNLTPILLSFNDLARAFVIDRDFSYTEILSQMPPEQRKEVVKLMLGLTTQEIADAEEEIRITESKIQRLTEEIRGIERLLTDFQVGNLLEIAQRRSNLQSLLDSFQSQEETLRNTIEQGANSARNFNTYQGGEYQALREEFIEHRSRIEDIENEIAVLTKQLQEKSELRVHLESEVDRLERHTSSQYVLSTFMFSRCPRCLQPVTTEMKHREQDGNCMLCGRLLQGEREFDNEAWSKALDDAKKAVQESQQL